MVHLCAGVSWNRASTPELLCSILRVVVVTVTVPHWAKDCEAIARITAADQCDAQTISLTTVLSLRRVFIPPGKKISISRVGWPDHSVLLWATNSTPATNATECVAALRTSCPPKLTLQHLPPMPASCYPPGENGKVSLARAVNHLWRPSMPSLSAALQLLPLGLRQKQQMPRYDFLLLMTENSRPPGKKISIKGWLDDRTIAYCCELPIPHLQQTQRNAWRRYAQAAHQSWRFSTCHQCQLHAIHLARMAKCRSLAQSTTFGGHQCQVLSAALQLLPLGLRQKQQMPRYDFLLLMIKKSR